MIASFQLLEYNLLKNTSKMIQRWNEHMSTSVKKCTDCGSTSFVQASDFINLRPLDKKLSIGSERVYTVCLDCGEVVSIKVKNPEKLK